MLVYAIHSFWTNLASPLYSLKKDIVRVADGDLASPVALREEDEFHDLAMDIDKMRSDMRHRWARIKERQEVLASVTSDLSKSIAKGTPSVSHATLLRENIERMKEEINAFTY